MPELVQQLFGLICGQDPAHTWGPGGLPLPFCQRCTGLYVGAAMAAWLHWRCRPKLTGQFLEAHGAFLLLMVPFGFHWLPQGALLRTETGVLFGFGIVTFLWLPVVWGTGQQLQNAKPSGTWSYVLGLVFTLVCLPGIASLDGAMARQVLVWSALAGVLALAALAATNIGLALRGFCRVLARLPIGKPAIRQIWKSALRNGTKAG